VAEEHRSVRRDRRSGAPSRARGRVLAGADAENSRAVYAALAKFGAPVEGLTAKDFTDLDSLFRMGTPPVMVDIMPRISGIEFEDAWQRRVNISIDENLTAPFISRPDLLAAKLAAGREQDLIDADALRRSAQHCEDEQPQSPTDGSRAFESMQQAQERGVEEWLKLRQSEKSHQTLRALRGLVREGRLPLDCPEDGTKSAHDLSVLPAGIKILIFSELRDRGRPTSATLRDAEELAEQAVIDMVIFAPLTGSDRGFGPNQHRAATIGQKRGRQFVCCARSSVG
jgi:hypothetical protein